MNIGASSLPHPFLDRPWGAKERQAAHVLWNWHHLLYRLGVQKQFPLVVDNLVERVVQGKLIKEIPEAVGRGVSEVCSAYNLSRELLAEQVKAIPYFLKPERFPTRQEQTRFMDQWVGSHALLLAGLAGAKGGWQRAPILHLARGFFLVRVLVMLPNDVADGRVFIPSDELNDQLLSDLSAGNIIPDLRRVLWRQVVRAKDALGMGQELAKDLPRRSVRALSWWWLSALEALVEIERRDYDLWSKPFALSHRTKVQVYLHSRIGKYRGKGF